MLSSTKGLGDLVMCSYVRYIRTVWWCLMNNLKALSCTTSPRAGHQSINKAESIPFIIQGRFDMKWELL